MKDCKNYEQRDFTETVLKILKILKKYRISTQEIIYALEKYAK
jgi:hypothetical protein